MSLFDAPVTLEDLLHRVEALEAAMLEAKPRARTDCPPEIAHAWGQWNLHRAGKGWTPGARKLSLQKLVDLSGLNGDLALQIVHQSIEHGWTALYAPKDSVRPAPSAQPKARSAKEALAPSESKFDHSLSFAKQCFERGDFGEGQDAKDAYSHEVSRIYRLHGKVQP
jgi:hypothetical protein